MERTNKLWNLLAMSIGAVAGASLEDDVARQALGAATGAFASEMVYFYLWMLLGDHDPKPTFEQQPSAELQAVRARAQRWYKGVVVCCGLGAIGMLAARWSGAIFNVGLAAVVLGAITFIVVWLSIGRRLRALEHLEFGDHSDPNMRALLRGQIDLLEYGRRSSSIARRPAQPNPSSSGRAEARRST
jgi:hypothetical protein